MLTSTTNDWRHQQDAHEWLGKYLCAIHQGLPVIVDRFIIGSRRHVLCVGCWDGLAHLNEKSELHTCYSLPVHSQGDSDAPRASSLLEALQAEFGSIFPMGVYRCEAGEAERYEAQGERDGQAER